MADKKTNLEVIKREIEGEPQSSEEPYRTYVVKFFDLKDDWTENDAKKVSEEPQPPDIQGVAEKCLVKKEGLSEYDRIVQKSCKSTKKRESSLLQEDGLEASWTEDIEAKEVSQQGQQGEEIQRRFHTDSMQEADSEDGWTEDDDAQETEAQQSKEADHQTSIYFIKEEPVDSDSADDDDDGITLQATSQSCSKQGGNSSMQSSYQSMRNTQEMSGDRSRDGARHLPEDLPLKADIGTQSDSSEKESCTSGNSSLQSSYQSMRNTQEMSGDRSRDGARHLPEDLPLKAGIGTLSDSSERESCTSGNSSLQSSYQSMRNTQEMSGDRSRDGARHLPEDFPLQAYIGTQSDSSERESCTSEYDSHLIPSQVAYFHEHRAADRETLDATTSYHQPGGMDIDRNADITMKYDEMINQSSQLRATGSDQNDPSCSLTKEKRFLCCVCSKGFTFKSRLSRHMRTHGGEKSQSKKPHQCMVCDVRFSRVDMLSRHIRSHTGSYTGEMPYKCSFCKKSLSTSGHLSRHIKIHTGEKPHECSFCKKSFSQSHHLSRHIKIHTGERPFECSLCSKTFSERGYLTDHQKIHTGEKPYLCPVCRKSFSRKASLTYHMTIHTGEKPFTCSVCDKSFREKSTRKKHMKTHT